MTNAIMNNEVLTTGTEMMVMDGADNFIVELTEEKQTMFCSMKATTQEERAILFKAMNNPEFRISDCINMVIEVKDVYCEVVTCTEQSTGEQTKCPRIVLIDKDGKGYQAVSLGIFSALKKVMAVFGQPSWETPIPLKIVQIKKGTKSLLTFDVV